MSIRINGKCPLHAKPDFRAKQGKRWVCPPPDAMQLHWTGWLSKGMQFSTSLYTLDIFGGALGINGKDILIQRMSICRYYKVKMKTEINKGLGLDSL